MDDVTQHPSMHHPLEVSYDTIKTTIELPMFHLDNLLSCKPSYFHYTLLVFFFLSFFFFDLNIGLANHKGFFNLKNIKICKYFIKNVSKLLPCKQQTSRHGKAYIHIVQTLF